MTPTQHHFTKGESITMDKMIEAIRTKFADDATIQTVNVTMTAPLGPLEAAEARIAEYCAFFEEQLPGYKATQKPLSSRLTTILISRP